MALSPAVAGRPPPPPPAAHTLALLLLVALEMLLEPSWPAMVCTHTTNYTLLCFTYLALFVHSALAPIFHPAVLRLCCAALCLHPVFITKPSAVLFCAMLFYVALLCVLHCSVLPAAALPCF